MTNEEIKERTTVLRRLIKEAEEVLKDIQNKCDHTETIEVKYSYRPGVVEKVNLCASCEKMLGLVQPGDIETKTDQT